MYNTSSSGHYLAVYANYKADFGRGKAHCSPASGPRLLMFFVFGIWLTTDTAGIIVLIVICTLTGILCAGCFALHAALMRTSTTVRPEQPGQELRTNHWVF